MISKHAIQKIFDSQEKESSETLKKNWEDENEDDATEGSDFSNQTDIFDIKLHQYTHINNRNSENASFSLIKNYNE